MGDPLGQGLVVSPFGARFTAARAREIGLVHCVVSAAEVDESVGRYIDEILSSGPEAVAAIKALIPQAWSQTIQEAAATTAAAIATRRVSAEGQEGMRAFLGKRKPSWCQ